MEETLLSLEQSKDTLKKENEKLRTDIRNNGQGSQGRKQFVFNKPSSSASNFSSNVSTQGASKYLIQKCNNLQNTLLNNSGSGTQMT